MVRLHWKRRDAEASTELAKALRVRPQGIECAVDDINVWGGSNRGWSSFALRTSPLNELVEKRLGEVISSDRSSSRRAEALWIMWNRTGQVRYLIELFKMARNAGESPVGHVRLYLQQAMSQREAALRLSVLASEDIEMSEEEFAEIVSNPANVWRRIGE